MIRRLFTVASVVSFLLFAGAIVLWVRSYRQVDFLDFGMSRNAARQVTQHRFGLYSCDGELGMFREWNLYVAHYSIANKYFHRGWQYRSERASGYGPLLSAHGFRYEHLYDGNMPVHPADHFDVIQASIPHWLAALMAGSVSCATSVIVRKRRSAPPENRCRSCRYDLRASADRCPECGTPIPTKVEAKA